MKPVIGINLDIEGKRPRKISIQANYVDAVLKAGGIPVLIAPVPERDLEILMDRLDGLMLIGGRDYDPALYGENACSQVELVDTIRQDFDLLLVSAALKRPDLPILGICAGCQLLNISLGGSLHQDIQGDFPESQVIHTSKNGWNEGFTRHDVLLERGSMLSGIYKTMQLSVPTSHHQSIKRLGTALKPTAYAEDGIIEAVEHELRPFTIGVQWHPERDFDGNRALFEAFIRQAAPRRQSVELA